MVGHFLKRWAKYIKLATVDIWVVYFTYTLTQTLVCIYICKTCLKRPLKNEDQLLLNAGQKYFRMLQWEHSAIGAFCNTFYLN